MLEEGAVYTGECDTANTSKATAAIINSIYRLNTALLGNVNTLNANMHRLFP